jgi:DNA-binding response OmpR family regulator
MKSETGSGDGLGYILVVDDDPSLVRFVSLVLRSENYEVKAVGSGREGLSAIAEGDPSLIVLDLRMPEMDGREFYRQARGSGYTGPVIVCSAYGAGAAKVELGADAAIDKPFDPESLISTVKSLVGF